eukprot:tig00020912_g15852.t1
MCPSIETQLSASSSATSATPGEDFMQGLVEGQAAEEPTKPAMSSSSYIAEASGFAEIASESHSGASFDGSGANPSAHLDPLSTGPSSASNELGAEDADEDGDFVPYSDDVWAERRKQLDAWYWEYGRIGRKNGKEFIKCTVDGCSNRVFNFAAKSASAFTRHLAKHEFSDPLAKTKAAAIAAMTATHTAERTNKRRNTPKPDRLAKLHRQSAPSALPASFPAASSSVGSPSTDRYPSVPWAITSGIGPGAIPATTLNSPGLMRAASNDPMAARVHIRVQCEGLLETANVSFHPKLDTFPDLIQRAATALGHATDGPMATILMDGSNMRNVLRDRGGYIVGALCDLVPDELYRLVLL